MRPAAADLAELGEPAAPPAALVSTEAALVAGVAAGLASRVRTDAVVLRAAFVVLAAAGGVGIVLYGLLWAFARGMWANREAVRAEVDPQAPLGVALIVGGLLVAVRTAGWGFADGFVWPVSLVGAGVAFVVPQIDRTRRVQVVGAGWSGIRATSTPASVARALLGLVLLVVGVAVFLAANLDTTVIRDGVVAAAVILAGTGLILGPWIWGLGQRLVDERSRRVRADERAAVAAHLHDSVLQTLALVQRRSDDPREVVALARRQERELRSWLYGRDDATVEGRLGEALTRLVADVEDRHRVEVELVMVGDVELGRSLDELVAASGEALVNAAKFSECQQISLYSEVDTDAETVTVFIRDRGVGFDPSSVPDDRLGVSQSILGRMDRAGGTAEVTSTLGEGTEVELRLALDQ